jgi:hypothetical protein
MILSVGGQAIICFAELDATHSLGPGKPAGWY